MNWDIHGNPLPPGHCEVHPDIAQLWPCDLCCSEASRQSNREDINAVLALHQPNSANPAVCAECYNPYPCQTHTLLTT